MIIISYFALRNLHALNETRTAVKFCWLKDSKIELVVNAAIAFIRLILFDRFSISALRFLLGMLLIFLYCS